jgi:glycosyltransferase involved in cell wall biosynthesis
VETVYNGIDLETYWNPALVDAAVFRTNLGIPTGEFCLGFVGRLNQGKGAHFVLDSFLACAHKLPGWHLVFVGKAVGDSEENYLARLRAVCDASPHRKRIHFPGYQTRMPEVMAGIDILANASEFESLGMAVVEAMAMAKPALGPAAGGIPEIIEHERTGFLYRPNDRNDFTLAFQKLAKDAKLREKLGKHGREVTLRKFNLTLMAAQIADLFGRVLNAPHP